MNPSGKRRLFLKVIYDWPRALVAMVVGLLTNRFLWLLSGGALVTAVSYALILDSWGVLEFPDQRMAAVDTRCEEAQAEAVARLDEDLQEIRQFIAAAQQRTGKFAEYALGFHSKGKLLTDGLFGRHEHDAYLRERFRTLVFSDDQLQQLVESVIRKYQRQVEDIETNMLVTLQADMADLTWIGTPPAIDADAVRRSIRAAVADSSTAAQADFLAVVQREIVSWVGAELAVMAGTRLAVSAGVLSSADQDSWKSIAATLAVGVVVDQVVSAIDSHVRDPQGQLARRLNADLDDLATTIIDGTPRSPGLRPRLLKYAEQRDEARRAAIAAALFPAE